MPRYSVTFCVATLCVSVAIAAGQPPATRKDSQSAFEARSSPGAGQTYLEKFVGDWDVEKTFFPRTGEPAKTKGECRQTMIHEGRFLQSEFVFTQEGRKSTGLGLIGFDTQTGQFTTVWTDSRSTRMSLRQSQSPFSGAEIVLFSKSLEKDAGSSRMSRTVTRLEANGNRIVHRQYAIGTGGQERLVMELSMTRKGRGRPLEH